MKKLKVFAFLIVVGAGGAVGTFYLCRANEVTGFSKEIHLYNLFVPYHAPKTEKQKNPNVFINPDDLPAGYTPPPPNPEEEKIWDEVMSIEEADTNHALNYFVRPIVFGGMLLSLLLVINPARRLYYGMDISGYMAKMVVALFLAGSIWVAIKNPVQWGP